VAGYLGAGNFETMTTDRDGCLSGIADLFTDAFVPDTFLGKLVLGIIIVGGLAGLATASYKTHPMAFIFAIIGAAVILAAAIAYHTNSQKSDRIENRRTVKSGTLVLRPDGSVLQPGEDYYDPSLKVIDIGPPDFGRVTFKDAKNNEVSRLVHWTPNPNPQQATAYVNFFHRGDPATAKSRLLAELSDVFAVYREGADTRYLQDHIQDRYGVTMRVEVPPAAPPPPTPKEKMSGQERALMEFVEQLSFATGPAQDQWMATVRKLPEHFDANDNYKPITDFGKRALNRYKRITNVFVEHDD
jgi:hypothetical protein